MDTVLLFRKRTPLTDDRLPWLRGSEEHPWIARRNARRVRDAITHQDGARAEEKEKPSLWNGLWRGGRDSNPRLSLPQHSLSRRAQSSTLAPPRVHSAMHYTMRRRSGQQFGALQTFGHTRQGFNCITPFPRSTHCLPPGGRHGCGETTGRRTRAPQAGGIRSPQPGRVGLGSREKSPGGLPGSDWGGSSALIQSGGRGIRTPGGLPHTCFQDRHHSPLGHPSRVNGYDSIIFSATSARS